MSRRLPTLFAALAMLLALPASAPADDSSPSPEAQSLIERQLDAFAHDDAAAAYAFASPSIRQKFEDANTFMAMVESQYAPVYRHRSVEWGSAVVDADTIVQAVTFIDSDNQVFRAIYTLARQSDGSWLISGCVLLKSGDKAT